MSYRLKLLTYTHASVRRPHTHQFQNQEVKAGRGWMLQNGDTYSKVCPKFWRAIEQFKAGAAVVKLFALQLNNGVF